MISFQCLSFDQLSIHQLYDLMQLRQEVFVVEQDCVYLDADGKDQVSWHLLGFDEKNQLVAYSRIIPKGHSYPDYVSFGRVATSHSGRGKGYGKILLAETINQCKILFGNTPIKIGAQSYLLSFYESFQFKPVGQEYLEDGIPHISMIRTH